MPRDFIMFRHHFEENGQAEKWKEQYRSLTTEQRDDLMVFVSHTVSELKTIPCPTQFKNILPYYLIKYTGTKQEFSDNAVQLSLFDDSDVVIEDE